MKKTLARQLLSNKADDAYRMFGLTRDAAAGAIRHAYFKLLKTYVNRSSDPHFDATRKAYMLLTDPEKRFKYDRFGWSAFKDLSEWTSEDLAQYQAGLAEAALAAQARAITDLGREFHRWLSRRSLPAGHRQERDDLLKTVDSECEQARRDYRDLPGQRAELWARHLTRETEYAAMRERWAQWAAVKRSSQVAARRKQKIAGRKAEVAGRILGVGVWQRGQKMNPRVVSAPASLFDKRTASMAVQAQGEN